MSGQRVLLAPTVEAGKQIVRGNPDLADVRIVTPRMRLDGLKVTEILIAEGAAETPGFDRAMAVLEHSRRKSAKTQA